LRRGIEELVSVLDADRSDIAAVLLTEICFNPANAGTVLDDPLNSQDHPRKECIAQRLMKEASHVRSSYSRTISYSSEASSDTQAAICSPTGWATADPDRSLVMDPHQLAAAPPKTSAITGGIS
jgi:hypothetical protein